MELHRLQPMKPYDPKLFNELYKKTERLRKSLVYQIDSSRWGVTQDEVMSWFDDKFIFVFNKYQDQKKPDILLGYLINSLKMFKQKCLRRSYQQNNAVNLNSISIEDLTVFNIVEPEDTDNRELLIGLAMDFLQNRLSDEAYELLHIQLNPPLYITSKLKTPTSKISAALILDFLGMEQTENMLDWVHDLRREIQDAIAAANAHFKDYVIA